MAQHYHREADWMLWLFRAIVHIARNYPSENAFKTAFEDLFRWRTYTGRFAVINAILVLCFCFLVYFKAVF